MVRLEKFDYTGYETLISWIDSAELLMQFAGPAFSFPFTSEQLNLSLSDTNRFAFKVVDANKAITIGHAEINLAGETAYLGRILVGDPRLRGRGLGQLIVSLLLNYAFHDLNKENVALNVFDWNKAAIKCYEKAGFCINPGKRAERTVNGKTWTALSMTLNRQAWMERQQV